MLLYKNIFSVTVFFCLQYYKSHAAESISEWILGISLYLCVLSFACELWNTKLHAPKLIPKKEDNTFTFSLFPGKFYVKLKKKAFFEAYNLVPKSIFKSNNLVHPIYELRIRSWLRKNQKKNQRKKPKINNKIGEKIKVADNSKDLGKNHKKICSERICDFDFLKISCFLYLFRTLSKTDSLSIYN